MWVKLWNNMVASTSTTVSFSPSSSPCYNTREEEEEACASA
jgi:hypothetical protein